MREELQKQLGFFFPKRVALSTNISNRIVRKRCGYVGSEATGSYHVGVQFRI